MEVMLSIILFSLMVWAILWSYNSILRASIKTANTQDAIQVAEDFLERINDTSMDYEIDIDQYDETSYEPVENRNIINTGTLYLKSKYNTWKILSFSKVNESWHDILIMNTDTMSWINLMSSDKVNVDYLNFEIYPDNQYINITIRTRVLQWEGLYKSWIFLSTTVQYKTFYIYQWEITPETLCEDVCSISDLSDTWTNEVIKNTYVNLMKNWSNNTMSSCTLWVWAWLQDNFINNLLIGLWWLTPASTPIFNVAKNCKNSNSSWCITHCDKNTPGRNPFNCWYILNEITKSGGYTWNTCSGYDSYIKAYACQDMCMASIFSCLWDDDPLIKRTWIPIKSWEFNGMYLQNPQKYIVPDNQTYNKWTWNGVNWWKCNGWSLRKVKANNSNYGSILEAIFSWLFWSTTYIWECSNSNSSIYCDGNYYGTWNNEWLLWLDLDEYDYDCVKWTWTPQSSTQNIQWNRIVYTPKPSNSGWVACVCQVAYTYSLNQWGVIEAWDYGWMKAVISKFPYEQNKTELEYIPKTRDLIYVDSVDNPVPEWNTLTWINTWLWINSIFNTWYCTTYKNNICTTIWAFNSRNTYRIHDELWFYGLDSSIPYNKLACANSEEYSLCISSGCCPAPWKLLNVPTAAFNYTNNDAWKAYCQSKNYYWNDNKCYKKYFFVYYDQRTFNVNDAKEYYCKNKVTWWYWDSTYGICINNDSYQLLCIAENPSWGWIGSCGWWLGVTRSSQTIDGTSLQYCKNIKYDSCILWQDKNIYKDYSYLCWFSVTEQTNSILNIIHSITNMSQTTVNRPKQRWRRLFW